MRVGSEGLEGDGVGVGAGRRLEEIKLDELRGGERSTSDGVCQPTKRQKQSVFVRHIRS